MANNSTPRLPEAWTEIEREQWQQALERSRHIFADPLIVLCRLLYLAGVEAMRTTPEVYLPVAQTCRDHNPPFPSDVWELARNLGVVQQFWINEGSLRYYNRSEVAFGICSIVGRAE